MLDSETAVIAFCILLYSTEFGFYFNYQKRPDFDEFLSVPGSFDFCVLSLRKTVNKSLKSNGDKSAPLSDYWKDQVFEQIFTRKLKTVSRVPLEKQIN